MDITRKVSAILGDAERKLAALTADALQRRDYAAVHRLSAIAEHVARAVVADRVERSDAQNGPSTGLARSSGNGSADISSAKETKGFPRFFRDSNQLVKIGYSRSERRSYEHRSPREALDELASLIAEVGTRGKRFTTDQILPPSEERLARFPTYQVYLCLAFLVHHGIVQRHGRSGYTINGASDADPRSAVDSAWSSLPSR